MDEKLFLTIKLIAEKYNWLTIRDQDGSIKVCPTNETETKPNHNQAYKDIIKRLNEKANASFKATSKPTQSWISARLSEGFTVKDFYDVIDHKSSEWLDDPKMRQYLRPATLFIPSKFEGYLSASKQKPTNKMYELLKDEWDE